MILFQTEIHDIIYTGDFRASKSSVENMLCLRGLKNVIVYVDSTFLKKSYMDFPTQSESVEVIINEIRKHLSVSTKSKGKLIDFT